MNRLMNQSFGLLGLVAGSLAAGACATSSSERLEPAVAGEANEDTVLAPELLASSPPVDVDVVRIELTEAELAREEVEIKITCYLDTIPGTRIVTGQTCRRIGHTSDIAFHPEDWDLEIRSPGVYAMRPRQ